MKRRPFYQCQGCMLIYYDVDRMSTEQLLAMMDEHEKYCEAFRTKHTPPTKQIVKPRTRS